MLREIDKINQPEGDARQRWFTDDFFDLFVWQRGEAIVRFQLTYAKGADEHSLIWELDAGYRHDRVDDGEGRAGKHKASPILQADGLLDGQAVAERFERASENIDAQVAAFVLEKIRGYGERSIR